MKHVIILTICLMATGMSFAQTNNATRKPLTAAEKYAKAHKTGVGGYVRTGRSIAIPGVQAFLYASDSSAAIVSSGYTDEMGYYETNFTPAGKYNLKLVYPNTAKSVTIAGVVIKKGITDMSLKMNEPAADTTLPITDFMPKPAEKKKAVKKK
jgi:hypothetical protein